MHLLREAEVLQSQGRTVPKVCRVLGQPRTTQRYECRAADDEALLTERVVALASEYGRYGYRGVTVLVWSYGLVFERTVDGKQLKLLTKLDEYSRECLTIEVGRKLFSEKVLRAPGRLFVQRGILPLEVALTLGAGQKLIEGIERSSGIRRQQSRG